MPSQTLSLSVKYEVDTELAISVEELLILYLTDIPMRGLGGSLLSDEAIEQKIKAKTEELETSLDILIPFQRLLENADWSAEEFNTWGFIRSQYPCHACLSLVGKLGFSHKITYPVGWISINQSKVKKRAIFIIAGQNSNSGTIQTDQEFVVTFSGLYAVHHVQSIAYIPNYWDVDYLTGWTAIPAELVNYIGKGAAVEVLNIMGDINFGAGIASKSISMDGVSQSVNTTQSAENSLYSARIRMYNKEMEVTIKALKSKYKGIGLMTA